MARLEAIRRRYEEMYEAAIGAVPIVEGVRDENAVKDSLASLVIVDIRSEQIRRAKEILDFLAKPGGTTPQGQLSLPGFDVLPWEPDRLLRDGKGGIIEATRATPAIKRADAMRARAHADDADRQATIKEAEAALFEQWAAEQAAIGRPAFDLTWGNCVRELRLLQPE